MDLSRPRPPYVQFERRVIERRSTEGAVNYDEVDFVCVTPLGSRDTVERAFSDWIASQSKLADDERIPREWVREWRKMYDEWKAGNEIPLNGTPLRTCPAFGPAEVKRCVDLKILTVEDLAAANAEAQSRLGMGAISMVQRAQDWLKASQGTAPLVAQLDSLRQVNKQQEKIISDMSARLAALEQATQVRQVVRQDAGQYTPPSARLNISPDNDGDLIDSEVDAHLT